MPIKKWGSEGVFFNPGEQIPASFIPANIRPKIIERANSLLKGKLFYFSNKFGSLGSPLDWFLDPFTQKRVSSMVHWSRFNEFSGGDIKTIWEASRFEWAPLLAQAWLIKGEKKYLDTLNTWLLDWVRSNPANAGVNWKCGQEASIRVINLLLTARLLGTHKQPSQALIKFIAVHCRRIFPSIRYAVAQNNNHGTSEAAALFIGGAWLFFYAKNADNAKLRQNARKWRDTGRHWLEDRVIKLIEEDGSFSQYSVNYHRVLLDTLCQVESWRRELGQDAFSNRYMSRCCAAVNWLAAVTDPETGDVPNIGANDGAHLYNLSFASYRDFRPSVQLGSAFFRKSLIYDKGFCTDYLKWVGIRDLKTDKEKPADNIVFHDGGYVALHSGDACGYVRFANFNFRPGHADCLHFDFWYKGENILRDGGSFSYNTDGKWLDYFAGTESHNTVQFDDRNQMPRISRFLFGDWLKMDGVSNLNNENGTTCWSGSYKDQKGCCHKRTIEAIGKKWRITDNIKGFKYKAVLRWRLNPCNWELSDTVCKGSGIRLEITSNNEIKRMELVTRWESRYYLEKTELSVLEIEVGPDCREIVTTIVIT